MTGGAGFIGSNFVHHLVGRTDAQVTVLDSTKFARLYGVTARPWRESLARCLKDIEALG